MLIWVSYLSSYFCFCHEVFSKRKFWIGLWSGVWIALQKYCWSDPRIALQKLYWIGVWIAFQKFWSVQCTAADDAKWDSIRNRMRKKSDDGDNDAVDLDDIERIDGLILRHKRPFRVLFEEGIKSGRFVQNVIN